MNMKISGIHLVYVQVELLDVQGTDNDNSIDISLSFGMFSISTLKRTILHIKYYEF